MVDWKTFCIYSILAFLFTFASGGIPLIRNWKKDHLHHFVNFSAGILLGTAFLHLLPDVIETIDAHFASALILSSFVFLYILEKFLMIHACEESHCEFHHLGMMAFVGMAVHTFLNGISLGAAFFMEGIDKMVFLAIISHKIPESFSLSCILRGSGWSRKKVVFFLIIFSSIIPLGALVSKSILNAYFSVENVGIALSLSLGSFIYVATSDFLPEVHRNHKGNIINMVSLLLGIALVIITSHFFHH